MEGQRIIAQKSAYLASEVSVEFETVFTKRFSSGLLGGEGMFLVRLTGPGKVVLQSMPIANLAAKIVPWP